MTVHGWRWGCGVSDDTGGVIPPTSASNLQHEKDTLVTPYLPPTILYPHPSFCPTLLPLSLSLIWTQIKQCIRLRKGFYHNLQSNIRKRQYLFISGALIYASIGQEFHSVWTVCFQRAAFSPPFFVKEWLNSKTVADNSHFFQSRSSQHVSFLEEKLHTDDNKIKSADSSSKPPPFPSHPSRSQNELTWEENKGALGIVESVDIRTACGDFPVDEDCLTRGKYLFRSNWERNNTAAKTSA